MDPNTFPTKGNLILAKNSLALARQGYELMDKKRNILIREMMELIDQAKDIQTQIDATFRTAYAALQKANMELGIAFVQQVSYTVPVEDSVRIKTRSVMGTEIPLVEYDKHRQTRLPMLTTAQRFLLIERKSCLRKGKRALYPARLVRKCSDPSGCKHQKNTETSECSQEYYDSSL